MARINSVKKLVVEDYSSDDRQLVQKLAQVLNPFLEQVSLAINGQQTLRDNLKSKVYKISLPAGTSARTVAWNLNEKPTSVIIGALTKTDGTAPADVFCLSWRYDGEGIHLTFLGLDGSTDYISTIIAQV